jgi:acetyl esterase
MSEVDAKDDQITGTEGHNIPIRIYAPKGLSSPAPAAVFFHGDGWILGNIQADDIFCRMISRDIGHVVVNVEYRLAPEHVHPAGLNDCYDAFVWVRKHLFSQHGLRLIANQTVKNADKLNIDSGKIYVTGNSAGGAQ